MQDTKCCCHSNWQSKSRDDAAELVRQLQSKEVEVADMRRNAELVKQVAAADTTKPATADVNPLHFLLLLSSMSD